MNGLARPWPSYALTVRRRGSLLLVQLLNSQATFGGALRGGLSAGDPPSLALACRLLLLFVVFVV